MKTWQLVILVLVVFFFIVGMIAGNYNCGGHFCTFLSGLVNFITDVIKTEVYGITSTVNFFKHLF